jgi:hypothetical protein
MIAEGGRERPLFDVVPVIASRLAEWFLGDPRL